ncbi:hypothetical protein LCGC14_2706040 [marine sediment metagenome]|uniref:Uncharacterized protein n=1 Tax=marine sediment metagenome TaxID=412755 RepID=A0A0F9A206_9ZZZZ
MKDYEERCDTCGLRRFQHDPTCPDLIRLRLVEKSSGFWSRVFETGIVLAILALILLGALGPF